MNKLLLFSLLLSACGTQSFTTIKGDKGDSGIIGLTGLNGHSAAMSQVLADSSVCSNGGYVLSLGVDLNNDSVLQASETQSVSVVCNGLNGEQGAQGIAGVNPTPITVVPLCPGINSYPGVFIEVGLCINNNLIGVYSANGGFATTLSSGSYSSNAIGSSCNLTINGCTVTH